MTDRGRCGRVHLAAQLPESDGLDYASVVRLARIAERGLFDFVLVDGGLPVLAALAAVTERVGLVGTVDIASAQPFEVARQFATLDHLSGGRAGWTVTGEDAGRAEEFLTVVHALWDSWAPDAVVADVAAGVYARPDRIRVVEHRGEHFDVRGVATLPAGPQGRPVLVHTAATPGGLEFGFRHADVVFTTLDTGDATADRIATDIDRLVQSDICDGVILVPGSGSHGVDELEAFVEQIVPSLAARGCFRSRYDGFTLREDLAL